MKLSLYWQIWWFDIPVHAFGGAVVALGVFTLCDLRWLPNRFLTPLIVLGFVLFTALVWELFEVYIAAPFDEAYYVDTISDLILGMVGGYLGYIVGNRLRSL